MIALKCVTWIREMTSESGSEHHTVMVVSFNKPCVASSYAKRAYLSTLTLRLSRVFQVPRLALKHARTMLLLQIRSRTALLQKLEYRKILRCFFF